MKSYKEKFDSLLWIKTEPNDHEKSLFQKGQFYITKLSRIPGIEMIAIVNSLSMYATHHDSDIDLFIITRPHMIWFVRFFVTLFLWKKSVWRKGKDIRENFCLSFFITTEAMNLSKIAIKNDIYLYYWIYYLKPIYNKNNTYENFLNANSWVQIDKKQIIENSIYRIENSKKEQKEIWIFWRSVNQIIRFFLLSRTRKNYLKLWSPNGVIISDTMLKFHDQDKRESIRNKIFENNFDK